jgi:autoinducer 2-degrading protein
METHEAPAARFVVCVTIRVVADKVDAFVAATRANAEGTRKEPKNLRFDVLRTIDDPARFLLYEVYTEEAGFLEHQRTPHYLSWREAVGPLMAEPRVGVKHSVVFPDLFP